MRFSCVRACFKKFNGEVSIYFKTYWRIELYSSISNKSGQLGFSLFMLGKKKKDLRFSSEAYLDFLVAYFEKRNDLLKILSHSMLTETIF